MGCSFFVSRSHAANDKVLTVYTFSTFLGEFGPGEKIKESFEKKCQCTLNYVVFDGNNLLLRRLELEKEKTKADIVIGFNSTYNNKAKANNVFAPHGQDLSKLNSQLKWQDDVLLPFAYSYMAFVFDKTKLKKYPHSFKDFSNFPNLKVIIADPRTTVTGFSLIAWVKAAYGDKSEEIWKILLNNIITITKGWSESYNLFMRGEADMVLSYITSPVYHSLVEKNNNFDYAMFLGSIMLMMPLGALKVCPAMAAMTLSVSVDLAFSTACFHMLIPIYVASIGSLVRGLSL